MNILSDIRRFYWQLRATKWKLYFKPNGPRTWVDIRFTGFRELHDSLDLAAQYVGMTNTNDHYYTACVLREDVFRFMSDETKGNYAKAKQTEAERRIQTYIDPECHCRVGFHWKCPIHYTWSN
jgi:hypothetical protein